MNTALCKYRLIFSLFKNKVSAKPKKINYKRLNCPLIEAIIKLNDEHYKCDAWTLVF